MWINYKNHRSKLNRPVSIVLEQIFTFPVAFELELGNLLINYT